MRLYAGSSVQFIEDAEINQIAGKLKEAYLLHFRRNPFPSEYTSWQNSLRAMASVVRRAGLLDHGVFLEYQVPMMSVRLDCMVTGHTSSGDPSAVIVELKQWSETEPSEGENELMTFVGGRKRDVLHPSVQVGRYRMYLADVHTAFYEDDAVSLTSCSYLHNYLFDPSDPLFDDKFTGHITSSPVFTADQVPELTGYLQERLSKGGGMQVLRRIEESRYRPSKKLMEHVSRVIKGKPEYVLIDEQLVAYDKVLAAARSGFHNRKKHVVIIKGGPGTGKSVVAINLMADLLSEEYNAHYATGSRAFTETLRAAIGPKSAPQFRYFNSYVNAEPNEIDVLICDEAHRLRKTSSDRWTPKEKRTDTPQVEEIIKASRVSVFLLDNRQAVRQDEVGRADYIRRHAERLGCDVEEFELEVQFRCAGSEVFTGWVNNTLGIERTPSTIWDAATDAFDFRIFDSPEALETAIRAQEQEGHSARMTAGYCWPWSKKPNPDGSLVEDVVIGDYQRPWNARPKMSGLRKDIPEAQLWAYDPAGIDQVGCVYTAQGFEFDYVGVIWGKDLTYDLDEQEWGGDKKASKDPVVKRSKEQFLDLVKNTYRVLLTRGMKGCYVYFQDKDTERFFKSRMERG